ncbi:MAG TPA: WbqC family protein [Luteibaculaceae bacterium]|nr:WbqC family protein [Luteibaculaceae bacterium]
MNILLPINYIGTLDYWALISQAEQVVIDDLEPFVKQTYRNRMEVLGSNGVQSLSIPVKKGAQRMRELSCETAETWRRQHWQALLSAYNHAPYFDALAPELAWFYEEKTEHIFPSLLQLISQFCHLLHLSQPVLRSNAEQMLDDSFRDFRDRFKPSKNKQLFLQPAYHQVFSDRFAFAANLSLIDLIANQGPRARDVLKSIQIKPL